MLNGEQFKKNKDLEYSSVQKAISILLSFIPDNKPMGNLELSMTLGLNKSTVSRLIQVLVYYGLIQQDEETKKFALGRTSALLGMAVEVSQTERLVEIARPYIDNLRDTVGESVCLEVLISGHGKVICEAVGPPPLSVTFPDSNPMHVSAGAKAILAFSDRAFVDSMINGEFDGITENTITDPEEFTNQLKEVKQQGVAFDHGEANIDVHAVSAAVFNYLKKPIAAICVCVPANRVNRILNSKVQDLLKKTAESISDRLFFLQN
jgi:DNA-binding IclR family transcriptional regulator